MRRHYHVLLIPLMALLVVVPLILKGPSCGHDFQFHLHSWLEVSSQWKQGYLFPHWDFTAAWNSGEPRFVFYPPISWVIGALLGLLLPWVTVPTTFIWIALTFCGFGMYRLAREWTTSAYALIPAALYMVHPYMLFTVYERAAYAELLAAAWIPLLLLAILRPRLTVPGIALPIALLWLTNVPAAVMACYTVAFLGVIRLVVTSCHVQGISKALKEAVQILGGALLGVGLAAFYVIPVAVEQRWVHINLSIPGERFQDNFLFGRAGDASHVAILRTASICAVILVLLCGVFLLAALALKGKESKPAQEERNRHRGALLSFSLLACILLFMLTSPSAVLWNHLPELRVLQFPGRLCVLLGTTAVALLALAMPRNGRRQTVVVLIALAAPLALSFAGNSFFRQFCHTDDALPNLVFNFYHGGGRPDGFDQYTPVGADPDALGHANPAFWMADTPTADAPPTMLRDYSVELARRLHFQVSTPVPRFFIANLRNYSAWKATVNGRAVTTRYRKDGLFALPLGSGSSRIDFTYSHTWDQAAGWIVTALSGLWLLIWVYKHRQRDAEGRDSTLEIRDDLNAQPTHRLAL